MFLVDWTGTVYALFQRVSCNIDTYYFCCVGMFHLVLLQSMPFVGVSVFSYSIGLVQAMLYVSLLWLALYKKWRRLATALILVPLGHVCSL